jgi:glycosyltransferase involved in cell wall biosynthesis
VDLTVLLCTYNRAHLLPAWFDALRCPEATPGLQWEVLVVDNNSSDPTPSVVDRLKLELKMPVRYVFERQQGKSFALNTGIAQAKGQIIAFTDDDALPAADWVHMIHAAFAESCADVIGGRILPRWADPVPPWLERDRELHDWLALMPHDARVELRTRMSNPQIWGANMALRRDVFDRVGGFDTRLGPLGARLYRGGEEVELIDRARNAGARVVYDPRLVVWHIIGPDRMRRSYFRRYAFQNAEGLAWRSDAPAARQLLGAPLHAYRRVSEAFGAWVVAGLRGRDAFRRELDFLHAAGWLWGRWRTHFQSSAGPRSAPGDSRGPQR